MWRQEWAIEENNKNFQDLPAKQKKNDALLQFKHIHDWKLVAF